VTMPYAISHVRGRKITRNSLAVPFLTHICTYVGGREGICTLGSYGHANNDVWIVSVYANAYIDAMVGGSYRYMLLMVPTDIML
jgi:hypothetical protein